MDYKSTRLIPLHENTIRDIKASPHPNDPRLLTASTDKSLKVVHSASDNTIITYNVDSPIWSCAWDKLEKNHIYCGTSKGQIFLFDLRQTKNHLKQFTEDKPNQPIHTLDHILSTQTLLSASTAKISLKNLSNGHIDTLPAGEFPGSCISVYQDLVSKSLLASFRYEGTTLHKLFDMNSTNAIIRNTVTSTTESRLLSRSILFPCGIQSSVIAATEGSSVSLWNAMNGNHLWSMELRQPPMDYAFYTVNKCSLLGVLSSEELNVYKLD